MFKTLAVLLTLSTVAVANDDLTLPGERWEAKATGYVCAANGQPVSAPAAFEKMNVQFEYLRTDYSLDNGLIKATFSENGATCSYSALLLADNSAANIKLVTSKAWAPDRTSNCQNGKAILDQHLAENNYLYWGRPHHLTIMAQTADAALSCGQGATHVGIDFTVSRRIQ